MSVEPVSMLATHSERVLCQLLSRRLSGGCRLSVLEICGLEATLDTRTDYKALHHF